MKKKSPIIPIIAIGIAILGISFLLFYILWDIGGEEEQTLITIDDILEDNLISLVGEELILVGSLSIPDPLGGCAGNCVRIPTLRGINSRQFTPLFGNMNIEDDGKLIKVHGEVIETPDGVIPNFDYFGEDAPISLEVSSYEIISNISYHDFLISESTAYMVDKFGCAFSHNKEVGWTIEDNSPYLKVKWDRYNDSHITLYYNVNGTLIRVEDEIKETDLC